VRAEARIFDFETARRQRDQDRARALEAYDLEDLEGTRFEGADPFRYPWGADGEPTVVEPEDWNDWVRSARTNRNRFLGQMRWHETHRRVALPLEAWERLTALAERLKLSPSEAVERLISVSEAGICE
jgi:hypothetical protein